ncbi:serine protease snake-like [Bactrocera neohumeralis]|uniref:serine protease snake-like n=1 Tax=Bactrocera neohumeralis TaxID=98809 RepID=UPI00216550EE|nr:serine protease snake-like [Bactrocera neohumeralis]
MHQFKHSSPALLLLTLWLFGNMWKIAGGQNNLRTEVRTCTEVKRQIFEEVKTFSAYIHGAQELKFTVDNCKPYAPLIVGGSPASPKEFPHIARLGHASINKPTEWFCGGTLISERFVLTAAHCFSTNRGEVNIVRLGDLDFGRESDDARPEDFRVRRYIEHNEYNSATIYNDIALVELERPVTFDAYKHPACLPTNSGDEFQKLVAIGWGSTRFADSDSKKLLKVTLNRLGFDQCQRLIAFSDVDQLPRGVENRLQICAGSNEAKDTCSGDSGGPLLAYHPDYPCMYTVIGITSYGIGCGIPGQPGIYTRVYSYIDWIRINVWGQR